CAPDADRLPRRAPGGSRGGRRMPRNVEPCTLEKGKPRCRPHGRSEGPRRADGAAATADGPGSAHGRAAPVAHARELNMLDRRGHMSKKKRDSTTGVETKYEEVRQLLAVGKERGFLAYDEINETLPDEISSSTEEIEEFFSLLESHGVAVVDTDAREQLGPSGTAASSKDAPKDDKDDEGKE